MEDKFFNFLLRNATSILRINVGIIYVWFGALKLFSGKSPAEKLAADTIQYITFSLLQQEISLIGLALFECLIGIGFLFNYTKWIIAVYLNHLLGTLLPLIIFQGELFQHFPSVPNMEGQYIIKNLVLLSAGLVIWSKEYFDS